MSTRFADRKKTSPTEQSTVGESNMAVKRDSKKKGERKLVRFDSSSALYNLLHCLKTLKYCRLSDTGDYRYTIKGSRWTVGTDRPEELIVIETEEGHLLVVHYNHLVLNGKIIEKICVPGRCYTANDIRSLVVSAISRLIDPWPSLSRNR
jgi:hypothetical protein